MKTSARWLRSWVDTSDDMDTVADRLTMAGLEVDAIEPAAPPLHGIVVGQIETCVPHPQADRLQLCRVDVGAGEHLDIVCGAPNARAGLRVPVATIGSILPSGVKIKSARLRGESSRGMLCSASELGFVDEVDGLWVLDAEAPIGQSLADYLGLPDEVLDIDLTPNRGDCLSIRGIAREVAVGAGHALVEPAIADPLVTGHMFRPVHIDAPDDCAGYAAQCVTDIDPSASSPMWLKERLRRSGVRHINLAVDIGNYVMLELGQPMHAFDAAKLRGDIRVRRADAGETIVTLDGENVTLADNTLVIADDDGPVAIAGMIGGQRTAVGPDTTDVVLEAACFTPAVVAGRGRQYKIHTDSLHRFERGVDPVLHVDALKRACGLLLELGGGTAGPATTEIGRPIWPVTREIELRSSHVERLLGQPVPDSDIVAALENLGFAVASVEPGLWRAVPPSWRFDITIEVDLIEEVARVYGYEDLQGYGSQVSLPYVQTIESDIELDRVDEILRERGYSEAITYSFVEARLHALLTGGAPAIELDNPISDQYVEMRRTLWASLLPSWHYNVRRQQSAVRLYERGLRFVTDAEAEHGIRQIETVAGIISGLVEPMHWDQPSRAVDFFDLKGDVEALIGSKGVRARFVAESHPALHPGRCARIYRADQPIGWLGQLAPEFSKHFKNSTMPYVFEVDSASLQRCVATRYEPLSEQPLVRRDLAVLVSETTPVAALIDAIESVDADVLQSVQVFDIFRGESLETGFKSVALGLIFQDKASTLTDEGVETIITRAIAALGEQCGARIRGE